MSGACAVACDLTQTGTFDTELVVWQDDNGTPADFTDDDVVFEGNIEDGNAFECRFAFGTGTGELKPTDSSLSVEGTEESDDIDVQLAFHVFEADTYNSNDRVRCDAEVDAVRIETGSGDDWVSCEVDECAFVDLGPDDDSATFDGPAVRSTGTNLCASFPKTPNSEIRVDSGPGDDCVIGTSLGRDKWYGEAGDDQHNGRGNPGGSDFADGGSENVADACWLGASTIDCENPAPSPPSCPSYSP